MASSLSSAKLFSSFISTTMTRRGFAAAAAQGAVSSGGRSGAAMAKTKRTGEEMAEKTEESWVPDPITGCYRPENQVQDIDAAELRAVLLNHKN